MFYVILVVMSACAENSVTTQLGTEQTTKTFTKMGDSNNLALRHVRSPLSPIFHNYEKDGKTNLNTEKSASKRFDGHRSFNFPTVNLKSTDSIENGISDIGSQTPKYDTEKVSTTAPDPTYDTFLRFMAALERTERQFYLSTFTLTSAKISGGAGSGISFAQSALALQLLLTALSAEAPPHAALQINNFTEFTVSTKEKIACMRHMESRLPNSSDVLKFRWSSRLVTGPRVALSAQFRERVAPALGLRLHHIPDHTASDPERLADILNQMVSEDSYKAIRNAFDPEELIAGVDAVLLSAVYLRAQWRSAPTLLNGAWPFYHTNGSETPHSTRMFRVNDIMGYAKIEELNAEVIEVPYATSGLSLVMVMPHVGHSGLSRLTARLASGWWARLLSTVHWQRMAVTLPLYTLRMTLLLPNKLQHMGMSGLVSDTQTAFNTTELKLSHGVQTIMFGNEAGRNAYKDDGLQWDEPPEMELVVDRPHAFFVRWHGVTLLNGNFVL